MEMALTEGRLLLTEDKNFGQLAYATTQLHSGVLLLRWRSKERTKLPQIVVDLVAKRGDRLVGRFIVVEPGRVRLGSAQV